MVTSPTMDTVVKQWVQLCDPLLHKKGFNCHTRRALLPWLPNLTFHDPTLSGSSLHDLESFKVRHFWTVEATGLKLRHRGHLPIAWRPCRISWKCANSFKNYQWGIHTDGQTAWWSHKPPFHFSQLPLKYKRETYEITSLSVCPCV
jgi:hypothetical protein